MKKGILLLLSLMVFSLNYQVFAQDSVQVS